MRLEHCGTIDNNIVVTAESGRAVTNTKIFQLRHLQPGRPLWTGGFIREEMKSDLFNKQTTPLSSSSNLPRNPELPNFEKENYKVLTKSCEAKKCWVKFYCDSASW